MKTAISILAATILIVTSHFSFAGTIAGHVTAEGKPGTDPACGGNNYESRAYKFATKVDYTAMRDFVVYIEGPVGTNKLAVPEKPVQVDTHRQVNQRHAAFDPHILPVVVGTTVEWPNNDDIFHNVFSYSEVKPFDLELYMKPKIKSVTFDKPGRVDVFCSIHSSMSCVVLVLENPFFAKTEANGIYTIRNVPAGTYKLKAWHERLPAKVQEIVVPEKGEVKADFILGITGLPKL
jgi:plastocyanin